MQGRPVGLYAACLVHSTALILMWSELVARAPVARGSRSRSGRSEAPPSAACPHLKIDHVYVVPEAPLEPLVLVLLFQQSALGTMEPSHIPAPLATLWATPGAAPPVAVLWSPFRSGSHAGKTVEARPRNEVFQLAVRACLPILSRLQPHSCPSLHRPHSPPTLWRSSTPGGRRTTPRSSAAEKWSRTTSSRSRPPG